MRLRSVVSLVVIALIAGSVLYPPSRGVWRALLLLPEIFVLPVSPIVLVSGAPVRQELRLARADADLILPTGRGRVGGLVMTLGVRPLDKRDPIVTRFTDGLARAGVAVLVVQSDRLVAGAIDPDEPENLIEAFELLMVQPRVDPDRIGLFGFSAGGAIAALAAADPRLAERLRALILVGPFADARLLATEIQTRRALALDGSWREWGGHPLAREIFLDGVLEQVEDPDHRTSIASWLRDRSLPLPETTDASARAVIAFADASDVTSAQAALADLLVSPTARLHRLSPIDRAAAIRAPTILAVDRADPLVPYEHSVRLAAALSPGALSRLAVLDVIEHVQPRAGAAPAALARDVAALIDALATMLLLVEPAW